MNQDQALAILKSGRNVFLTGSAGTGKTFVLNKYIQYLKARKIPVSITASTGIAATHLQGTTIHAWSGIGIKDSLSQRNLKALKEKKYLKKHIDKTKVLIIDEISMLHLKQFNLVNEVLQYFRQTDKPFGGIQLVLCGDFFQLPPIGNTGETNRDKFCFMSQSWLGANLSICYLTEQFRQTDSKLNDVLNEIRTGAVSESSIVLLQSCTKPLEENEPTTLYTHNIDVDRINSTHIKGLKGRKKIFRAKVKGNLKLAETIKKSIMAPEVLELKKDSKVMFVKNNYEKGYLNGTIGTVLRYDDEGYPVIRLNNGYEITAVPEDWRIEDEAGKLLVSYVQVPLRLAWAITVHKSQGMTLDSAVMDLSKTFEKGQGYVALSRVKRMDGLELRGFNGTALEVDRLALRADQRFQELSRELELVFDADRLEKEARSFIKTSGGVLNKDEIKENLDRLEKGKKIVKKSTYLITKQLIDKGYSLEDIMIDRDLTIGTISTHLIKISEMYPNTNLTRFKPDRTVLNKVKKARSQLLKGTGAGERVSLKPIFEILKGEISYDQIKLALVFV
ncbi:AAA family ATPase [Lutimonas zeaxanthinifaciens]|uniref:AAA family ATPase n=1 Tax=Lutimonas zeaxanthinifaciens TaxID=3060215 RepID=UPI00265CC8E7|nr:AAA family ATPase [Lutimonas sp. YSD2104]WKK65606.1 AAA family ATPase [Lutimonas sp. YSD2104]